ncbi:sucrose phosphorylase [Auritidibacter ignavus]|uniref:sucrose phosphorylase n=1 Tax=Auritidibacter ignavus TaxID=678932 RepID=UPI00244CA583|nr:sucrose phosphorylase [Auritidibacter ignavus]WGH85418.1 sucrose phosphorylase [Auritidibacter ignavus]WGH87704.1 sucrose phosphorylase [Auritidibacter ignavus]
MTTSPLPESRTPATTLRNGVQLIVYANRFGGDLLTTRRWIDTYFPGAFTGVHLLPYFRTYDGADAGFDPIDHREVDPRLGDWPDVASVAEAYDLCSDMIVNHVSARSPQFQDFLAHGADSEYADMFLSYSGIFPEGATEDQLLAIYRPRPGLPFSLYRVAGQPRLLWTTFTSEQIDIDINSDHGAQYLTEILHQLAEAGVKLIRMDAVGYAFKQAGASSFMMPETFEFIGRLTEQAHQLGMEVLVEIHSYYQTQLEIASRVDWVYDFALPPLLLHTLTTGSVAALSEWIRVRPTNSITVLDTHDGIGVIDVGPDQLNPHRPGLLQDAEVDALVGTIHRLSDGQSRLATGAAASNLDLYQVNSTYYDALGRDDQRYLTARAIQFFLPGIPQVYYMGALVADNDMELLTSTGVGRDINRSYFTAEEVERLMSRDVNQRLLQLMQWRNQHPAFQGVFSMVETTETMVQLRWEHNDHWAQLTVDASAGDFSCECS